MRRSFLLTTWLATDILLFLGAYVLAYFLRVGFILSTDFPLERYVQIVMLVIPVWLGILLFTGTFRPLKTQASAFNIFSILASCIIALSLFALSYYFLYHTLFSRLLLVYAGILSTGTTIVWHVAFDQWQRTIMRRDPPVFPLLIVGTNRESERVIRHFELQRCPLKPVAILDSHGTAAKQIAGVPVVGRLNKLEDVIREYRITHLLQCAELEHTINLFGLCRQHGITYMLLPSVLGLVGVSEEVEKIEGQAFIVAR